MNMIDKFMLLIKDIDEKKKNKIPSPVLLWRIKHRKYEILKEIRKDEYNADDIRHICWVVDYAKTKWPDEKFYPDGVRITSYGKGLCLFQISIDRDFSITVNVSSKTDVMDIVKYSYNTTAWISSKNISSDVNNLFFTVSYDTIKYIIDKLIKGD